MRREGLVQGVSGEQEGKDYRGRKKENREKTHLCPESFSCIESVGY